MYHSPYPFMEGPLSYVHIRKRPAADLLTGVEC